MIQMTILLFQL